MQTATEIAQMAAPKSPKWEDSKWAKCEEYIARNYATDPEGSAQLVREIDKTTGEDTPPGTDEEIVAKYRAEMAAGDPEWDAEYRAK